MDVQEIAVNTSMVIGAFSTILTCLAHVLPSKQAKKLTKFTNRVKDTTGFRTIWKMLDFLASTKGGLTLTKDE